MQTNDHVGYGMRDGKLLFIEDVPRGLACGCVCVKCSQPLIAKKGSERLHHFAHRDVTNCRGANETILHMLAKELLANLDVLMIPPYQFTKHRKTRTGKLVEHHAPVANGGLVVVDNVKIEEREEGFVPDIIIESNSKTLIVEVAVSHKVDRAKLRRLRKRSLPAIEISLNASDSLLSRDKLKAKLQDDLISKAWLFHPAQREAERSFLSKCRKAIAEDRTRLAISSGKHKSTLSASRLKFISNNEPSLSEYDQTGNEFHRANGRYPTEEECLKHWPHLWKKP